MNNGSGSLEGRSGGVAGNASSGSNSRLIAWLVLALCISAAAALLLSVARKHGGGGGGGRLGRAVATPAAWIISLLAYLTRGSKNEKSMTSSVPGLDLSCGSGGGGAAFDSTDDMVPPRGARLRRKVRDSVVVARRMVLPFLRIETDMGRRTASGFFVGGGGDDVDGDVDEGGNASVSSLAADYPLTPRTARSFHDTREKRASANAQIRRRLSRAPPEELLAPFKVNACTWNVDQRPPPEFSRPFVAWLLGEELAGRVYDHLDASEARAKSRWTSAASRGNNDSDAVKKEEAAAASFSAALAEFPDVIIVALQEIDMGGVALVRESTLSSAAWTEAIMETLHAAGGRRLYYRKLKVVQLVGLMLIVLVQARHSDYISHVRLSLTRTGAMRVLGNKGSVAMRATIYGKRFLFITAHFAAHKHNERLRMANYHAALNDLRFDMPAFTDDESEVVRTFASAAAAVAAAAAVTTASSLAESFVTGRSAWDRLFRVFARPPTATRMDAAEARVLDEHDYIFFLGDLNSRLHALGSAEIRDRVSAAAFDDLLIHDELRQGMVYGDVFDGFEEQWIHFPPTYKFDRGTDTYDTSRKRRDPAWCDRVLFRRLEPFPHSGDDKGDIDDNHSGKKDGQKSRSNSGGSGHEHHVHHHSPGHHQRPHHLENPLSDTEAEGDGGRLIPSSVTPPPSNPWVSLRDIPNLGVEAVSGITDGTAATTAVASGGERSSPDPNAVNAVDCGNAFSSSSSSLSCAADPLDGRGLGTRHGSSVSVNTGGIGGGGGVEGSDGDDGSSVSGLRACAGGSASSSICPVVDGSRRPSRHHPHALHATHTAATTTATAAAANGSDEMPLAASPPPLAQATATSFAPALSAPGYTSPTTTSTNKATDAAAAAAAHATAAGSFLPTTHPLWEQKRTEDTFKAARRPVDYATIDVRFPMVHNRITPLAYYQVGELRQSDHRPVAARFEVNVIALRPGLVAEIVADMQHYMAEGGSGGGGGGAVTVNRGGGQQEAAAGPRMPPLRSRTFSTTAPSDDDDDEEENEKAEE